MASRVSATRRPQVARSTLTVMSDPGTGYSTPDFYTTGDPTFLNGGTGGGGGPLPQLPPPTGLGGGLTEIVGQYGVQGCTSLGLPEGLCQGLVNAGIGQLTGGGGGGGGAQESCPSGYARNPSNGVCEFIGSPGDISTPGGGPVYSGDLPPGAAAAVRVGSIQGNPIYRCPSRFVLADPGLFGDGVCFHKNVLPNKLRKWPKDARPPVSAYDAKMMRRYGQGGSKAKRVKKLAGEAGFSCKMK